MKTDIAVLIPVFEIDFIVSCRLEKYRSATEEWLNKHDLPYEKLYMRRKGDRRDDTIVKFELLEQIQADGYDPVLVFEDRDRVVQMWRDAGLKCLQVKPGEY